ncbi:hypothetical protein HYH03_002896 [Edaphochlamys debaryana]|uniref:Very-long-chain (3R)-3-hydroxyacyl-CoA dehydratase n=1 Tax=Edaphochlamys debaryana TaxID=47281 RepID=A0A836C4V4_9CHLO|nr:hypothetical protein HYH03_002896 [Edaphochlamys debaryana]|eukprot:KAG2499318.1 hypothetical protein HYH03_002896 [Edaphochlamys debaryana]
MKKGTTADLWQVVELPLKVSQSAAVMEIVHSALGVVRSPVMITGMQVFSRLWVVWGIINLAPAATAQGSVPLGLPPTVTLPSGQALGLSLASLLLAWSVTEVVRYGFFAIKEVSSSVPYPLLWLRYSTFIPLYPLGVASELSMVWLAFPTLWRLRPWCLDLPNALNWGFDYPVACLLIVAGYLPGLPQLYLYMLAQRKKVLAAPRGAAAPAGSSVASGKKSS